MAGGMGESLTKIVHEITHWEEKNFQYFDHGGATQLYTLVDILEHGQNM